jgi:hypothetical protein
MGSPDLIDRLTCLLFCVTSVVGTLLFYLWTADAWLPW